MDSAELTPRSLLASMLFEQMLRPLAAQSDAVGGHAIEHFAQLLAARLEKHDG